MLRQIEVMRYQQLLAYQYQKACGETYFQPPPTPDPMATSKGMSRNDGETTTRHTDVYMPDKTYLATAYLSVALFSATHQMDPRGSTGTSPG